MKKQIAALAIGGLITFGTAANAVDVGDLSITTTFAYESEYVFRGAQVTQDAFQGSVELELEGFYAGVWTSQPIDDLAGDFEYENEIDLYTGYKWNVTDIMAADVGFTYYWYPEQGQGVDRSREIKLGLAFDVVLSPAVYFYYDFDLEQTVLEFSGGYSYDISEWVSNSTINLTGNLSFLNADDLGANQVSGPSFDNGYTYWGLAVDYVYSFTDNASCSIGVRYTGNNDEEGATLREDNFWWGTSFTAGF